MTGGAAIILRSAPWAAAGVDRERVLAEVGRRFPGVMAWFGDFTGSLWAMVGDRLWESKNPREFVEIIATAIAPARPSRHRPPQPTTKDVCEPRADTVED